MALLLCAYIVNISKESLGIPSSSHETLILICFLYIFSSTSAKYFIGVWTFIFVSFSKYFPFEGKEIF